MKIELLKENISIKDYQEIERLISTSDNDSLELEDLWRMIDTVWDELGCDSDKITESNIVEFYQHPVWLLNGLFIEEHTLSIQHRNAISDWIVKNTNINKVLDYGGGFGTLARFISEKSRNLQIDVYEPFPHP